MANWYVYSGAVGTGAGTSWANAKTTLAAAATASADGDDIWVASDHAETAAAATTITFKGSPGTPCRIMSVSRAGSVPPVAADILAGGSISTTGANALNVNVTGNAGETYIYGLTFNAGSGASLAALTIGGNGLLFAEACAFNLTNTNGSSRISISNTPQIVKWNNCTASFGHVGQAFSSFGNLYWSNKPGSAAVTGAISPTGLFVGSTSGGLGRVILDGLDLSVLGSGCTIFSINQGEKTAINCKLNASVTFATAPDRPSILPARLIGCHSTSNVARNEISACEGALTTETTIKRTAGASDGVTAYSWKIVTTANAKRAFPFETFEGAIWNDTVGSSKTLTVHTVTNNVTLTDAEIWLEVEYLASSGAPVSTLITDANATVLSTPANQTSDSGEAWTTTGIATPLKQKLDVTFTPQMAGPIRWRVKVAKASATVYVCPKADLT